MNFQNTYKHIETAQKSLIKWENIFNVTLVVSGIIWGSAAFVIFPSESIIHQTFLAFILGGLVAGSVGVFSVRIKSFLLYSVPVLFPLIIKFFVSGDSIHFTMGLMLSLFWLIMFMTAKKLNEDILNSFKLKYENMDLILKLESEVENRKATEKNLIVQNQKIEKIVDERTFELKKSEELFKLITGNTSALVSIHDSVGDYLFVSPSHKKLGYKPEDLIGESGFTMMEEKDAVRLMEHLEKGRIGEISSASLNYRLKDKKGEIHYYRGSFDAVFKTDDTLEKIICVAEDITELRNAEAAKIDALALAAEAQKLALVGQIAGKMAHDFNNVLGVVMGNAEIALLDCKDVQTIKKLELIFEQAIRGKNLTKNLVAFARDQEPKQHFFNINEKLDLVITLLKKDLEGISVVKEYNYEVLELLADPGMIEHAMVNLIQNSIHATSRIKLPQIIIRIYSLDGHIVIEIEDNGCGIPKDSLDEIFNPSFTLKGSKDKNGRYRSDIKGTGYGMSNVKRYIEQHKGNIKIYSDDQKGTKVIIRLPITEKELTKEEIIEVEKEKICTEKYILLVEDEQDISDVQYRILTQKPCNHQVDIANNGQAAIDLLNKNEYDLISLDYILPEKINGMDVYHHFREKNKTVPVLFISGNIEFLESIKELKQKDPYVDHQSKPCKNLDYLNSISRLMA